MSSEKQKIIRQVQEMIDQLKNKTYKSPFSQTFAEVYIEDEPSKNNVVITGSSAKEESIVAGTTDPIRQLFLQMRHLSGDAYKTALLGRTMRDYVFYQQAKFMAAFEDDYQGAAAYSMYYPNYQMMSYEQLRTYFTWRTQVRLGNVKRTELSYVFVYVYELINNIGVSSYEDGIYKLISLWKAYREYTDKLDKYMAIWVRDYYIVNELSFSFDEVLRREALLQRFYPCISDRYSLDEYNELSTYKIKKSIYFTQDNKKMLEECFSYVVNKINELLNPTGVKFERLIFYNTESLWHPFCNAIYYPKPENRQLRERTVIISDKSIYRYYNEKWTCSSGRILTENGQKIVTYVLKRMEQLLRKATNFKYRLNADSKHINHSQINRVIPTIGSARFIEAIDLAVEEYYRNSRKKVIKVDQSSLEKIRQNALITQEKLIVSADDAGIVTDSVKGDAPFSIAGAVLPVLDAPAETNTGIGASPVLKSPSASEGSSQALSTWEQFMGTLNPIELHALEKILRGTSVREMHELAKDSGIMLEVLIDDINQKAINSVGDNILELSDEIIIYDEYKEHLGKAVGCEYN